MLRVETVCVRVEISATDKRLNKCRSQLHERNARQTDHLQDLILKKQISNSMLLRDFFVLYVHPRHQKSYMQICMLPPRTLFLDAVAKLRKATINFVMSVRPSIWNKSPPTGFA